MKITINTDILKKHNVSLGEFLVLLMGYFDINYSKCYDELVKNNLVNPDLFNKMSVVLSDNTKDFISRVIMESNDKIINSNIDFDKIAEELQSLYPEGNKPGTTHKWRGNKEDIVFKLQILVSKYDFKFTPEEARNAVLEYINSFEDRQQMHILRNFIFKRVKDKSGNREFNSLFMTIIENNRENESDY